MAESLVDTENPLNCPICLNLLKDPVTTSCGHSFCMDCIKSCWDQEVHRGVYSCPTCRTTFNQRPALSRSTVLADILEGMKKEDPAGPGDVTCDVCKGKKVKAIKSCLVCMASYCQTHIKPHYESEAFKNHKLVKASPKLQHQICRQHHKALEIYCYNDQKCICVVCMGNQHSGHKTVSAAAEMPKKQEQLKMMKKNLIQKNNDMDKEVLKFKEAVVSHKRSAQAAVENSDRIFTEIIRSIQNIRAEVREKIRAQENKEVRDAEIHIQRLQQKIVHLQKENLADVQIFNETERSQSIYNSEMEVGMEVQICHLENVGLTVNWTKSSLLPSQTVSFLGIELDSVSMTARLSTQRMRHVRHLAASLRAGSLVPLKNFQRTLGCMASASAVLQLGLLRMRLLQHWLSARVPHRAWASGGLCIRVSLR
ncbi:unnamed protein product [Leuciscus chuanchicus]